MQHRVDLESLIARLEQATAPDLEIDFDIWVWLGGSELYENIAQSGMLIRPGDEMVPCYTGNMEVALSLVPTGWAVHTIHGGSKDGRSGEQLWTVEVCINNNWSVGVEAMCCAETPAKAIALAALRAWHMEIQKAADSVA